MLGYVATLMSKHLSESHFSKNLAGIAFFQRVNNIIPLNNFLIKQALKGYRKHFPKQENRRPITIKILEGLSNVLPNIFSSVYKISLFRAAFILAFFAALRISEFVAQSKTVLLTLKHLT